jgi:hypothetical protein
MKQDMTVMDEASDPVSREKDCLGELKKKDGLKELMSVVAGENATDDEDNVVLTTIDPIRVDERHRTVYDEPLSFDMYPMSTQQNGDEMTEDTSSTQENGDEMIEDTNVNNRNNVVLRAAPSIMMDEKEESDYSEPPSIEIYPTNTQDFRDETSGAKRVVQLTKDYVTGNETFEKGSIGTVIEETPRKDRKLKIKLDKDTKKKYRLIRETELQAYTFRNEKDVACLNEPKLKKNCQSTDLQAYTFKNEKEVVCRNGPKLQKNCQSNSPTSDDESIEY